MNYIKGNFKKSIYENGNGYYVGLFKVRESDIKEIVNKTITFTGFFHELNFEEMYMFEGKLIEHERYGEQFKVENYEKVEPVGIDALFSFLSSPFIKGCGETSAKKLIDMYQDETLNIIKNDKNAIIKAGISEKNADKIFKSLKDYYNSDEIIMKLKEYGLSIMEINKLLNIYSIRLEDVLENDLYSLVDYIDFNKLDHIYFQMFDETNDMRKKALIIEAIKNITLETGDTYVYKDEIRNYLLGTYEIMLENLNDYLEELDYLKKIKIIDNKYYLYKIYKDEKYVADRLYNISENKIKEINILDDDMFKILEASFSIKYNDLQKDAIKKVINNNITIITGGPGVGKTTIVKGIVRLYQMLNNLSNKEMEESIALLAPTGRAAKRLSEATGLGSSTIHRYLKWNKDTDTFSVNEENPNLEDFIIIDEVSMIDISLMASLLKGLKSNIKLVLVGDDNQLPSIRCGNVLYDLIKSDMFPYTNLKYIYRQTDDSFIPVLASDIKNKTLDESMLSKKDDYAFIQMDRANIKSALKQVIMKYLEIGIDEKNLQILVPMYKSENGIDNINNLMQSIYNPEEKGKEEIRLGTITYRENDKIINLVNDLDNNIYNGDIGYITKVYSNKNKVIIEANFDNKIVEFNKSDFNQIKHAYAISIHKSQGSEFPYVVMPMSFEYARMLYNKLIYTGVSRAKKSLVLIGEVEAFIKGVNNEKQNVRKTSLMEYLMNKIN